MSTVLQLDLLPKSNRLSHLKASQLSLPEQDTLISLALAVLSQRHQPGETIESPDRMRDYLQLRFGELEYEVFSVIFLDNRHRILGIGGDVSRHHRWLLGTSPYRGSTVHLACNARPAILSHNHPSGIPTPSEADKAITHRLKEALALIDIRVLDHLIATRESVVSFAESRPSLTGA